MVNFERVLGEVEKSCRDRSVYMLGPEKADFISALVKQKNPSLAVECGTAIGYSGLWIARALKENGQGKLITLEIDSARDYDELKDKWVNTYSIELTSEGNPVPHKEIDFWYAKKNKPGYDSWNKDPIEKRMEMGGKLIKSKTGKDGTVKVSIPELDKIEDLHHSCQFVVRFNMDRKYPEFKPHQSPLFEFYSHHYHDRPIEKSRRMPV